MATKCSDFESLRRKRRSLRSQKALYEETLEHVTNEGSAFNVHKDVATRTEKGRSKRLQHEDIDDVFDGKVEKKVGAIKTVSESQAVSSIQSQPNGEHHKSKEWFRSEPRKMELDALETKHFLIQSDAEPTTPGVTERKRTKIRKSLKKSCRLPADNFYNTDLVELHLNENKENLNQTIESIDTINNRNTYELEKTEKRLTYKFDELGIPNRDVNCSSPRKSRRSVFSEEELKRCGHEVVSHADTTDLSVSNGENLGGTCELAANFPSQQVFSNVTLRSRDVQKYGNTDCPTLLSTARFNQFSSPWLFDADQNKVDNTILQEAILEQRILNKHTKLLSKSPRPLRSEQFLGSIRSTGPSRVSKRSRLSTVELNKIQRLSGSEAKSLFEAVYLTDDNSSYDLSPSKHPNSSVTAVNQVDAKSPPSGTSTPYSTVNTEICSTVTKNKSKVTFDDGVNVSIVKKSVKRKPQSRVKLPNFARIHQKQFERMESIDDYKDRKVERAKLLLSGNKPIVPAGMSGVKKLQETPLENVCKEFKVTKCNKMLTAVFDQEFCTKTNSTPTKLPPAVKQLGSLLGNQVVLPTVSHDFSKTPGKQLDTVPRKQMDAVRNLETSSVNVNSLRTELSGKRQVKGPTTKAFVQHTPQPSKQTSTSVQNVKQENFSTKHVLGPQNNNIKRGCQSPNIQVGFTRFGFKLRTKPTKEEVKSVATKSNVVKSSTEQRRGHIKGVRSNRRFDLLMSMRKK